MVTLAYASNRILRPQKYKLPSPNTILMPQKYKISPGRDYYQWKEYKLHPNTLASFQISLYIANIYLCFLIPLESIEQLSEDELPDELVRVVGDDGIAFVMNKVKQLSLVKKDKAAKKNAECQSKESE